MGQQPIKTLNKTLTNVCHRKFMSRDVQQVCVRALRASTSDSDLTRRRRRRERETDIIRFLLTKLKQMFVFFVCFDVIVLFYMSSKFIVVVDIL